MRVTRLTKAVRPQIDDGTPCTYCGAHASQWDHVLPRALIRPRGPRGGRSAPYAAGDWIVSACSDCNCYLSDRMLSSVPLRAAWLAKEYRRRHARLLRLNWSEKELAGISGAFRASVLESLSARHELLLRLSHLDAVAEMDSDYMRPHDSYFESAPR